jgi:hypothetical protein
MHAHFAPNDAPIIERRVLRALCTGEFPPDVRLSISNDLDSHRWSDPEHRIVFEALAKIPTCETDSLRELLPAQATRMGFPDVDWPRYFETDSEAHIDVRALVRALMEAAARE